MGRDWSEPDDAKHAALARLELRSWLTLGLAVLLVVLLNSYRAGGARLLARAVAEYAVVAALAVLLATSTGATRATGRHAAAGVDQRPAAVRRVTDAYQFVVGLWRQAQAKTNTDPHPTPTTTTRTKSR